MAPYRRTERSIRKSRKAPRDRAWAIMRASPGGRFTIPDLVATANVSRPALIKYLKGLAAAGYIQKIRNHCPSRFEPAVFQLQRDSGPFRPHLQSNGKVYDRNLGVEFECADAKAKAGVP